MGSFAPPNVFPDASDHSMLVDQDTDHKAQDSLNKDSRGSLPDDVSPAGESTSNEKTKNGPESVTDMPGKPQDLDLSHSIKGMYRLLDLVSEQGSGGLVDKIVIAQETLSQFINDLSPGAYTSLTKVDFRALDKLNMKPIGVYGARSEIISLLLSLNAIEFELAQLLQTMKDNSAGPRLRSGLYVVRSPSINSDLAGAVEQVFVIYWPEDNTWNDDADSAVKRNRVTFMRYLTKVTDQVLCLLSQDQDNAIVWQDELTSDDMIVDNDELDSDRLFTFEVSMTNEQEESIKMRTGFKTHTRDKISAPAFLGDCPVEPSILKARLLAGEANQAFMTAMYIPESAKTMRLNKSDAINRVRFEDLLDKSTIRLHRTLNEDALQQLIDNGLRKRFPDACKNWKDRKAALREGMDAYKKDELKRIKDRLRLQRLELETTLQGVAVTRIVDQYPTIKRERLIPSVQVDEVVLEERFQSLLSLYPNLNEDFDKAVSNQKLAHITAKTFKSLKERLILISFLLNQTDTIPINLEKLIEMDSLSLENITRAFHSTEPGRSDGVIGRMASFISDALNGTSNTVAKDPFEQAKHRLHQTSDAQFLASLDDLVSAEPRLEPLCRDAVDIAENHLRDFLKRFVDRLAGRITLLQEQQFQKQVDREIGSRSEDEGRTLRTRFMEEIEKASDSVSGSKSICIETLHTERPFYSGQLSFKLSGYIQLQTSPMLQYTVHQLKLTENHKQSLQMDSTFVPTPEVNERFSCTFSLPINSKILYAQLLEGGRCLVVIDDGHGNIAIYLDLLSSLDGAISRHHARREINQEKIGKDLLIAYDETKKMLLLCASSKLQLHIFVFDESFKTLQAWGSAVNLTPWYGTTPDTTIYHACFVSGGEEILLIDNSAQARIFSLVTQQFRPAVVTLEQIPMAAYSTADGACLLLLFAASDVGLSIHAYHWSTFGSNEGVRFDLPEYMCGTLYPTSFVNRNIVHLISIDPDSLLCHSVVLDITKKVTQFQFKEKGKRVLSSSGEAGGTLNNCLIDCHADVWSRFPVIAAVPRQTPLSSQTRLRKSLTFGTDNDCFRFTNYFARMIETFEQSKRKPTGNELKSIAINAQSFAIIAASFAPDQSWNISRFCVGEWLVNLLCLIPIHIAITRENRFIPLKDGMTSAELERSLLGAEVGRIVDSLSLGWYESIFQSYMTHKPVRVVSSMGEQSVGKSYALNHMVDSSFAGSAMRTTEGVWLSATPTEDSLIVALDFEGVHSIERSAQEDTLLVLFNTALSNLVLFRNNFALSRDITGLFQSFQSSSTVLDPAANPSLFQSTLVIIIKDVVDSDKAEIVKEFSLKFQRIVQDEQDANFISRLHAGRLNIIPWPVIESKQFYTLFPALKKRLDQQQLTHRAAGEFLLTLKTLMAKLKANDWGALSQTLVAHRAQRLLDLLPNALAFGFTEIEPDNEVLKNFDTDEPIAATDTASRFFLTVAGMKPGERATMLNRLVSSWHNFGARSAIPEKEWAKGLSLYLEDLVEMRISHVQEWITSNLSRFKSGHANIETLRRAFENTAVELKANTELCSAQCDSCHLLCLQSRRHSSDEPHDCHTSHQCEKACDYDDEHPEEEKFCGYHAGHPGQHICAVDTHLCGQLCSLSDKKKCLRDCTQVVGHEGEHKCSAPVHECGLPCNLKNLRPNGGPVFSCRGTCAMSSDEDHEEHICSTRMCPITCELCQRLCSNPNHLHGLDPRATHLCGQTHSCTALCASPGICEIETAPHSIEATFTGQHQTFQYTKYSQVSKRLQCVISIPAGSRHHAGVHKHTTDSTRIHFCETRCENCGYFCTLPRGHAQQEHETSHGSMSKTQWVVDGPDGTVMEFQGHKFAPEDDGAPMLCNLVCKEIGLRHVHVDYCRAADGVACNEAETQHITRRLAPNPDRAKDYISHSLWWRRSGFKDPYSKDDQANFAKCDAMCPGPEHAGTATNPPQPSYCILPLFHPPQTTNQGVGLGYLSNDGHVFTCKNPVVLQQAFHVIFVIDRSGSMGIDDRRPLSNTPVSTLITRCSNNRLGAVYSALHGFWTSRYAAINATGTQAAANRRDAYSVILFNDGVVRSVTNDFIRTPDQLLNDVLRYGTSGGTNYTLALQTAQEVMTRNWRTERSPVVIFLSDGECSVPDEIVTDLCRAAIAHGQPLSFHSVSFGPQASSTILRRMTQIALDVQKNAPRNPNAVAKPQVESSYSEALDTVKLAQTFLGIADSLRKPRGSLLH